MSRHLEEFLHWWGQKAATGAVADLTRIEVIVLELYDQWLKDREVATLVAGKGFVV